MRYWFGYLTAGIFAAITWLLTRFGERYATLVDMVYPYVVRTLQEYLANWAGQFTYPVWQALAVVLGMLILQVSCWCWCSSGTPSSGWAGCWRCFPAFTCCIWPCGA